MTAIAAEAPSTSARTWFAGIRIWHWAVFLITLFLVGAPMVFLVLGSFSTAALPTQFSLAEMGLDNYREVWLDPSTYKVVVNTFIYVTGATLVGLSIAVALAWMVERTNVPGKIWIYAGVPMTLAIPGMLQAMAWVLLLSPKIGFLNTVVKAIFGLEDSPFNVYSLGGMIFIEGLRLVPTAFLMLVPLLRSMDPSLEEAAAMSGAKPVSMLRKVTVRLMLPGLLAILIYTAMTALEVFEVPGILGMPAGIYVFSTKIYSTLRIPEYGQANALALAYVAVAIGATYLYSRVIGHSERYSIVTGKGYRPRELDLGVWRWPATSIIVFYLLFAVVLPFLALLYVSLLRYMQPPSWAAFATFSLRNYQELWDTESIGQVVRNTLVMVVLTATLTVIFSLLVSLVIVRSHFRGRKVLDQIAFLPHAIPGIVMGLAFLWIFLEADKLGIPIYGGLVGISIVFAVGFMSYGTRAVSAGLLQIHKDLEEAAYVSGAPYWRIIWRVFYPLMLPTFIGIWIWSVLHAIRQAGTPLILYEGAENTVLAVLIWNLWDGGSVETVSAIGVVLILSLFLVTIALRFIGFGRGVSLQKKE
jgi:iron(III) transport system permease protein